MNSYGFGPDVRDWLSSLIGDHFDGRPVAVPGFDQPTKPNEHLHLILDRLTCLTVYDGDEPIEFKINAGSRLVAYRPADSNYGILASILDIDGSQSTFMADKNHLVYWAAEYLSAG